jgi:hypothetical protein
MCKENRHSLRGQPSQVRLLLHARILDRSLTNSPSEQPCCVKKEERLPDLAKLLTATSIDDESAGLLRDGAEALVGVMAMVTGVGGVDIDATVQ